MRFVKSHESSVSPLTALSVLFILRKIDSAVRGHCGIARVSSRNLMPVTILDVAKTAGVSIKTVSRVINNESNVSDNTRDKVRSAIETLGYTPNPSAQRLARGHTGIVG